VAPSAWIVASPVLFVASSRQTKTISPVAAAALAPGVAGTCVATDPVEAGARLEAGGLDDGVMDEHAAVPSAREAATPTRATASHGPNLTCAAYDSPQLASVQRSR
jgi:hypothetical protein